MQGGKEHSRRRGGLWMEVLLVSGVVEEDLHSIMSAEITFQHIPLRHKHTALFAYAFGGRDERF